ncbi:HNH endonuclease [Dyadobacter sp. CY327]|uniref:HNH endonuclease n=1 Tax=Dyadobacter sp. CY327 TaxID=2907301 RepID=UPI001F2A2F57|nr:HNH endonuclease [Dyadobacter sp. CY327]MCE7073705.1 HNH endonuclease [Dyadobacter sp. CY327]
MPKQIPLTRGQFVTVDNEDFDFLNQWKWYVTACGYAARHDYSNKQKKQIMMHHLLVAREPGMHTDHINRDRLDNRRENLRVCSAKNNLQNKKAPNGKKFKGVYECKGKTKTTWKALMRPGGKFIHLGVYNSEIEAARAYNTAAVKQYGEYAYLNPV